VRYGLMAQEASGRAENEENAAMRVLKNDFGWSKGGRGKRAKTIQKL
jgi:hypothetical protein